MYLRQPRTCHLIGIFAGEERVEYLLLNVRRHARAVVSHAEHQIITILKARILFDRLQAGGDVGLARPRHGITGTGQKAQHCGVQLCFDTQNAPAPCAQVERQFQLIGCRALQQVSGGIKFFTHIDADQFRTVLADAAQQAGNQFAAVFHGLQASIAERLDV